MQWSSKNISYGGIFHPAKSSYTPETQQFLKVLMDESKMTIRQRKKADYFLRNGEPLPLPTSRSSCELTSRRFTPPVTIRPGSSKRRSFDTIVRSGAYEREKFLPREPRVDRELEKKKLQSKMAFGKEGEPKVRKVKERVEMEIQPNRFDELVKEIKEREVFLQKMEELGEGQKYKLVIQQQIQARVREMEKLKVAL